MIHLKKFSKFRSNIQATGISDGGNQVTTPTNDQSQEPQGTDHSRTEHGHVIDTPTGQEHEIVISTEQGQVIDIPTGQEHEIVISTEQGHVIDIPTGQEHEIVTSTEHGRQVITPVNQMNGMPLML